MENLNLDPATLAALAKLLGEGAKEGRPNLSPGEYTVDEVVTLVLKATVRVGEDYDQKIVGKAHPWALLLAVLDESEKRVRALAKLASTPDKPVAPEDYILTLEQAVKLAESVDPELAKEAQKEANKKVAAFKAPTLTPCKGKVTCKGVVETPEADAS